MTTRSLKTPPAGAPVSRVFEFGELPGLREEAIARFKLVQALLFFVEQGLRDEAGTALLDLSPLSGALAERFAPILCSSHQDSPEETQGADARAFQAFETLYGRLAKQWRSAPALPPLRGFLGPSALRVVDVSQEREPTALDALQVAVANRGLARSRALSLYCAGAHLPSESPKGPSAARRAYDDASKLLWLQALRFDKDVLMFSIVAGGEHLDACRKDILSRLLAPSTSLIQYLSPNGAIPGRWPADTEKNFAASLRQAAQ
jgi:hypothetical protein